MKSCHCVLESWMVDCFGLTGNELIIYAIIYGFSQDGKSMFMGSREYLSKWTSCTVRNVQRILTGLVDDGLIIRHNIPKQKTRGYQVNIDKILECNDEYGNKSNNKSVKEKIKKQNYKKIKNRFNNCSSREYTKEEFKEYEKTFFN